MRKVPNIIGYIVFTTLLMHGCGSTATSQEPQEIQVEFTPGTQQYSATTADTVQVVLRTQEQLSVSGAMRLPHPCFEVKASGLAYPDSLVLTIEATPTPQMCPMAETMLPYEAVIQNAISEDQELRVRHTFAGSEHLAKTFQLGNQ